jgi:hypothetical protein
MDRNYAYISITGTGNTATITESLGLKPTKSWNVGDSRKQGPPYEFSRWSFESADFEKDQLEKALEAIVLFVEERKLKLLQLPQDFQACIQCVGYHEQSSPGFHLFAELIEKIGSLGLPVDFDLYCHAKQDG